MWFRTHFATVAWLSRDDVAEARAQLRATLDELPANYPMTRSSFLVSELYLDFYTGEMDEPLKRIRAHWDELLRLNLLRVGILRLQLWHLRSASALLAAASARRAGTLPQERRLLSEARAYATRVARERAPVALPLSLLLHASIDIASDATQPAAERLELCIDACDRQGMRMFGAAARVRYAQGVLGQMKGPLLDEARRSFEGEGVVNWPRMVDLLAPGAPRG